MGRGSFGAGVSGGFGKWHVIERMYVQEASNLKRAQVCIAISPTLDFTVGKGAIYALTSKTA